MLVKNKVTNKTQEITPETWEQMQSKGIASRFKIVSGENAPVKKKALAIPEEVKQLRKKNEAVAPVEVKEVIVPEEVKELRKKKKKNTAG